MITTQEIRSFINEKGRGFVEEKANEAYSLFLKPNQQDQHSLFANLLGVERAKAKHIYYFLMYTRPEKLSQTMNLMVFERYVMQQYSRKLTKLGVTKAGKETLRDLADDKMARDYRIGTVTNERD